MCIRDRCTCSIHQQPGRTRRAHDEAAAEDLWWLPLRARRRRFRSDPLAPLHSQEARLGPSLNVDHRPPAPDRDASAGLNPACDTWAVTINEDKLAEVVDAVSGKAN